MRNALQYNTLAILVSESPAYSPLAGTGLRELSRIQSSDFLININREDIRRFDSSDFLARKIVAQPSVDASCSYLLTDGQNEKLLGFNIAPSGDPLSPNSFLSGLDTDRNLFIAAGGVDDFNSLKGDTAFSGVDFIGIGNCFLSSYSVSASVGSFPIAEIGFSASNVRYNTYGDYKYDGEVLGIPNPAINRTGHGDYSNVSGFNFTGISGGPLISAIQHGGITVDFENLGKIGGPSLSGFTKEYVPPVNLSSFSLSNTVERVSLFGLGSSYAYNKKAVFPVMGSFSCEIMLNEFKTGTLSEIICNDSTYDILVNIDYSRCEANSPCSTQLANAMKFKIKEAKLEGCNFSSSIGSNASINLSYSFANSMDSAGLFASGSFLPE